MTKPEGKVLMGLDEFMLRLGHVAVLCTYGSQGGTNVNRLLRRTAERLTRLVVVDESQLLHVAEYLLSKRLIKPEVESPEVESQTHSSWKPRYPDLLIQDGRLSSLSGEEPSIWWQDLCLADPRIASRVGAVTVESRVGKTGLSHILDWALQLGLLGRTGEASTSGHLITADQDKLGQDDWNPYLLGPEIIVFASQIVRRDWDVFSSLILALAEAEYPMKRSEASMLFGQTIESLVDELRGNRGISMQRKEPSFQLLRELRKAQNKSSEIGKSSTAWHRTSSRFETYVDLGILSKGDDPQDKYKYVYYSTPVLSKIAESLHRCDSSDEFVQDHMVRDLLGTPAISVVSPRVVKQLLLKVIGRISRPVSSFPIESLEIGLSAALAGEGYPTAVGECRNTILKLAETRPDIARTELGRYSTRVEYISIDVGKLETQSE